MKRKRIQITVGPLSLERVNKLAARLRKESMSEWSVVDVLESATSRGLEHMMERVLNKKDGTVHVRE